MSLKARVYVFKGSELDTSGLEISLTVLIFESLENAIMYNLTLAFKSGFAVAQAARTPSDR